MLDTHTQLIFHVNEYTFHSKLQEGFIYKKVLYPSFHQIFTCPKEGTFIPSCYVDLYTEAQKTSVTHPRCKTLSDRAVTQT